MPERDVVGADERDRATARKLRGLSTLGVGGGVRERESRVARDERTQLAPRVTGGAEHADWNLMHIECILMLRRNVNIRLPDGWASVLDSRNLESPT